MTEQPTRIDIPPNLQQLLKEQQITMNAIIATIRVAMDIPASYQMDNAGTAFFDVRTPPPNVNDMREQ